MRYVSAYLLAVIGGKEAPGPADVENILNSVGINVDKEKVKTVISRLQGKSLEQLIAEGSKNLVALSGGSGGSAPAAAAAPAGGAAAAAPAAEEKKGKKEEKKEESEEEDMGFGLFD